MNHRLYQALLDNPRVPIVIAYGPAGTGKTLMACRAAGASKRHDRVILTRPAVSVDEQHGYLPGTLEKKMDPWIAPMADYLPGKAKREVCPLAYMRGRTFNQAWIIADEMQNSTPSQMRMVLTRLGHDSKLVITGDTDQHDRGFERNGLIDLIERLKNSPVPGIEMVKFEENDVMRNEIIKHILRLYKS
jgi:phosphate starvation-inducible protein PhoH and related proteins